ncbi:SurA N-terminal domain-containing protein [Zooshikella marina]|uniref:SurA N-terminal domain-containing protein n=1 Tax=Zooshikella ganghwensis TaxID=202772 RepID=UPI001BAFD7B6|nr:SurA N-terminal domain-containing protein [Zooshikella ganghwensis]MBU2705354.1 SurA N-terminal domain-containing protein [Zooshikella ganghwensis]
MLQTMRDNAQSWVVKVIVFLIIFVFAIFGLESLRLVTTNTAVATVNDEEISQRELARAVNIQINQMAQSEKFDPAQIDEKKIQKTVLDQLIDRTLLTQTAKNYGLFFPEQAIDREIISQDAFKEDGKYSPTRFEQLIRQAGFTPRQYKDAMVEEMLTTQLQYGIAGSEFLTSAELKRLQQLEQQTRSFRMLTLPIADIKNTVEVTEEELTSYYQQHEKEFMSAESVKVNYLLLEKAELLSAVDVDEEDIKARYDQFVEAFKKNEPPRPKAAHILLEVKDDRDAEATSALALEIEQKLQKGESFADLAKQYSDDQASAENGGDLGFVEEGIFGEEFDKTLAELKTGEVSKPLKMSYGVQLVKLVDMVQPDVPSFEDKQEELTVALKEAKAEPLFVEKRQQLEDLSYQAADLQEPAEKLKLEIKTSDFFSKDNGKGIFANSLVVKQAFSPEVLTDKMNSAVIDLSKDKVMVLHVLEHQPAKLKPLSEIKEKLITKLKDQKAVKQLEEQATSLVATLREGKQKTDAATQEEQVWKTFNDAKRMMTEAPREAVQQAFKMPHPQDDQPQYGVASLVNGDRAIIELTKVTTPEKIEGEEQQQAFMKRFMAMQRQQIVRQQLQQNLRETAEVSKNL